MKKIDLESLRREACWWLWEELNGLATSASSLTQNKGREDMMKHGDYTWEKAYEAAVLAGQEVHKARTGEYHKEPYLLLRALEEEDGELCLGGPEAELWDDEMFRAAKAAFDEVLREAKEE